MHKFSISRSRDFQERINAAYEARFEEGHYLDTKCEVISFRMYAFHTKLLIEAELQRSKHANIFL